MMTWDILTSAQYQRLCECRSRRTDVVPIAKAYMKEREYDSERALETAVEHLGANNQFFDFTSDEWTDMLYHLNIWSERQRGGGV